MEVLFLIMIIASCFQCLELAGYKSESDLKKSDKTLFVVLPITYIFWVILMNQNIGRN